MQQLQKLLLSMLVILFLSGCRPTSQAYQESYAHLQIDIPKLSCEEESDYFLILYVNARHLDYTDNQSLVKTIAKHPSDGSKNGDVGHAWIYLQGVVDGQKVFVEGGHSGELGLYQAKYFEGVMNYIDYGYANPTPMQRANPRKEPNPIKYLWATQTDGFFQEGSGGHTPTFSLRINISKDQFFDLLAFIENYPYRAYSLTSNQCASFVQQVAARVGVSLESEVTISINQKIFIGANQLCLWQDPRYAMLTFSSPDILERSMMLHCLTKRR